jgi:hypothetical protein
MLKCFSTKIFSIDWNFGDLGVFLNIASDDDFTFDNNLDNISSKFLFCLTKSFCKISFALEDDSFWIFVSIFLTLTDARDKGPSTNFFDCILVINFLKSFCSSNKSFFNIFLIVGDLFLFNSRFISMIVL